MSFTSIFESPRPDAEHLVYAKDDAQATMEFVKTFLPGFEPQLEVRTEFGWWLFTLPRPRNADYQFSLHGEIGGERQISAKLLRPQESSAKRFWYLPLEMAGSRDSAAELQKSFHERVKNILSYPTRIIEKRGLFFLSHRAQFQSETGWQRVGGVSRLSLGLGVPFIGWKRVYTSPAVVTWVKT